MPVATWSAPALLPPSPAPIYEAAVHAIGDAADGTGTVLTRRSRGKTAATSIRLRGTILHSWGRYVVTVTATVSEATLDVPLRESVVKSHATVVSREFTP
jgi:hypothetical protein